MATCRTKLALGVALGALMALPGIGAQAATISGWNTDNVSVGVTPPDFETGESVVFDRDPAAPGAVTNGKITFTPPEAVSPGIKVVNGTFELGGPAPKPITSGCLMTSSSATCDSPFQSGKRIKQQMTGTGPMDLVFNVDQQGVQPADSVGYQVFHRLINNTGQALVGFDISLGTGIGDGFTASTAGDGLGFSPDFRFGPTAGNATSQFPFGLFGDAATAQNFDLDGFFAPERTGFNMNFSEDKLSSAGYFGPYKTQFGDWQTQASVPDGGFWDNDNDPTTDDLLMAWNTPDGKWEVRRGIDSNGDPVSIAPIVFDSFAEAENFLNLSLVAGAIEDLANLNTNFAILLGEAFGGENFTLRVNVQPVPLPAGAPLILAGIGALGLLRRRRRALA